MRILSNQDKGLRPGRRLWPASAISLIAILVILGWWWSHRLPPLVLPVNVPLNSEWSQWGADDGGTRYARIGQITPGNAPHLTVAWRYSTGELLRRSKTMLQNGTNEMTPILAAGLVNRMHALWTRHCT